LASSRPGSSLQVVEEPGAYIHFVVAAFALTLGLGPLIGVLLWLSRSGIALAGREEALVQAHGWAQLVGWAGIFVAGFSLRLAPRFAGRPEPPERRARRILGLLVVGMVVRSAALAAGSGTAPAAVAVTGALLEGAGMLGVSLTLVSILRANRHPEATWAALAAFGAAWWACGALLQVLTAALALGRADAVVPYAIDRGAAWAFLLGAIGNFIWAVQSRMMPFLLGRPPVPRRALLAPILAYNIATLLVVATPIAADATGATGLFRLRAAALAVAGACIVWLAIACGAIAGEARRLRPASQHLARYIVWANRWAVLSGGLLVAFGVTAGVGVNVPGVNLEDGALHAFGTGLITMLIAGMLQLVAPVFAMERMGGRAMGRLSLAVWWLLLAAASTRVLAAILPRAFNELGGLSALAGWLGLALLVGALGRARLMAVREVARAARG